MKFIIYYFIIEEYFNSITRNIYNTSIKYISEKQTNIFDILMTFISKSPKYPIIY